jgi:hypothetical protein
MEAAPTAGRSEHGRAVQEPGEAAPVFEIREEGRSELAKIVTNRPGIPNT